MRLIDADAYKDYICRNCIDVGYNFYGAKDISKCPCGKVLDIEYRPTAYDVDAVIKELEKYGDKFSSENEDDWYAAGVVSDCEELVKRGGVDE